MTSAAGQASNETHRRIEAMAYSWIFKNAFCNFCLYEVIVTQSQIAGKDYCFYCSNPACLKHAEKENLYDDESPDWAMSYEDGKKPTLLCNTCGGHDTVKNVPGAYQPMDYRCRQCQTIVSLEYCRGHDVFFELFCPYCEKLK